MAITPSYIALATTELSGGETAVTFSSIPSSYRHLVVSVSGVTNSISPALQLVLNGDTNSNYSYVFMYAESSGDVSGTSTHTAAYVGEFGDDKCFGQANIFDYSATNKHKLILTNSYKKGDRVDRFANRWASLNAVNSVQVNLSTGSFNSGSRISLYGVG